MLATASGAFADETDATGQLEELVVTGQRGFGADTVQAGGFRNTSVLDTPLTVNVIPRDVLIAQGAEGLYDALRNTGGVTRSQLSGGTYDNIAIRGILVENRGNYRLNGSLPIINLVEQPLENKDRIEVLKGASALYYGFVPPSGIINMTTKRAGMAPVTELTVRGDEHGTLVGGLDLGRRLIGDRVGVRLNLAGGEVATGIDKVDGERALVALALDFDLDERISVDFDFEHIRKDVAEPAAIALLPAVGGRITLPNIPDNTLNLADAWQRYDAQATNILGRVDVKLSPRWAIKLEGGRAETSRDRAFSQFETYNLTTGEGVLRIFQTRGQRYENLNLRAELTGLMDTGPVEHELTFGWTRNERKQNGVGSFVSTPSQNLFKPRAVPQAPITAALARNPSQITDIGAYVFDRMTLGRVQVLAGVRWSDYESRSNLLAKQPTVYTVTRASPTIAVVYKPASNVSLYATYVEGLEEGGIAPANALNVNDVLPPATSKQWEAGVKAEFAAGVVASAAYFEITRPSAFTNAQKFFVLDGETDYRGVELMASGEVTENLSIVASGLWLDAELARAADVNIIGKRPENTPEWTASAFAEWRTPWIEGLALNGGVFYVGERAVNALNQAFVDGYVTTTLGARLTREIAGRETRFQVNVENAFDEAYWNTAGNGLIGVGAPRTIKFTLSTAL